MTEQEKKYVLVVEDECDTVELLGRMVRKCGLAAVCVQSVSQALEEIGKILDEGGTIIGAILDFKLTEGKTSLEVERAISQNPKHDSVKFLFISARPLDHCVGLAQVMTRLGTDRANFVQKPFGIADLKDFCDHLHTA